jgi:GH15 family glucan-1,4-alpha-glucosidase
VRRTGGELVCQWGSLAVSLTGSVGAASAVHPGSPTRFTLRAGESAVFTLAVAHREPLVSVTPEHATAVLAADEERWRAWAGLVDPDLPFREAVLRSLLTLRLLTYSPSGAPVAAPTTSLPEELGGVRNWDYRYAWPRDASIGVAAFLGVGMVEEAQGFLWWLLHACRLQRPRLPVLLTLDGRRPPVERVLAGWPGFGGSTPVRVGNGAADQHQLDGYG